MELRLSGEVVEALQKKRFPLADSTGKFRRPGDPMTVDLATMKPGELATIHDAIEAMPKQNGYTKHMAREIRIYLTILEDSSGKVGKLYRLPSMLREYLKQKKIFRVYKKEHERSDIWLPYAITSAKYRPGSKKLGPASVRVDLAYYMGGEVCSESIAFYGEDNDRTIEQMFNSKGYRFETKELYEAYSTACERYIAIRGKFGHQVLGTGWGQQTTKSSWYRSKSFKSLVVDEVPSKLVVHVESEEQEPDKPALIEAEWWDSQRTEEDEQLRQMNFEKRAAKLSDRQIEEGDYNHSELDDGDEEEFDEDKATRLDAPLHAYTTFFDLEKHYEIDIHVSATKDYVYDKTLGSKLVLPKDVKDLVEMLLDETAGNFKDIIVGKSGGTIVLLRGPPGTGKTLTAEVYSEAMERPLYKIQSSQLGTDSSSLETELKTVLDRANLWNALLLIDECDVFVHERGSDLEQNAVVGVFLRVLEYFQGVLFLTTNRETLIDDAIMSRCTASIRYELPTVDEQIRIWQILAKSAGVPITEDTIIDIVEKYPELSGRDVKNLLKLGHLIMKRRKAKFITREMVDFITRFMSSPTIRREGELQDFSKKVK